MVELYSKCISTTWGGDASKLFPQFTGIFLCSFMFISLDKIILFVIGPISNTNKIVQTYHVDILLFSLLLFNAMLHVLNSSLLYKN